MWNIRTGGTAICTDGETVCREVFDAYTDWRENRSEDSGLKVMSAVGLHPCTWRLPIQLVDEDGIVVKQYDDSPDFNEWFK